MRLRTFSSGGVPRSLGARRNGARRRMAQASSLGVLIWKEAGWLSGQGSMDTLGSACSTPACTSKRTLPHTGFCSTPCGLSIRWVRRGVGDVRCEDGEVELTGQFPGRLHAHVRRSSTATVGFSSAPEQWNWSGKAPESRLAGSDHDDTQAQSQGMSTLPGAGSVVGAQPGGGLQPVPETAQAEGQRRCIECVRWDICRRGRGGRRKGRSGRMMDDDSWGCHSRSLRGESFGGRPSGRGWHCPQRQRLQELDALARGDGGFWRRRAGAAGGGRTGEVPTGQKGKGVSRRGIPRGVQPVGGDSDRFSLAARRRLLS